MERLKRRADFLAVAKGRRVSRPGFVLQALKSAERGGQMPARFGFTVTRQVGNAVIRNRIRRRLREAVRLAAAKEAVPGTDYVLIARKPALTLPFDRLIADLTSGLAALTRDSATENRPRDAR